MIVGNMIGVYEWDGTIPFAYRRDMDNRCGKYHEFSVKADIYISCFTPNPSDSIRSHLTVGKHCTTVNMMKYNLSSTT
jgi:hypothetical protein